MILSNSCMFTEGQKMWNQLLVSVFNNHKVGRFYWIFKFLIHKGARERERERALWPTSLLVWAKLDFHTEQEARRGCWVGFEHCDLKFEVCWAMLHCGPTCLHMKFKWFIKEFWTVMSFSKSPLMLICFPFESPNFIIRKKSAECHIAAPTQLNQSFLLQYSIVWFYLLFFYAFKHLCRNQ